MNFILYIFMYIYIYDIDIACIWNVLNIRHFGGIVVLGFDGSNDFFKFHNLISGQVLKAMMDLYISILI